MLKKSLFIALVAATFCLTAQAQKFGYVNSNEIIQAMPETATAQNQLKTVNDKYETEYKNLTEAFQKKLEQYQKQAEDATTPQAIKDRHEQELQQDYEKIQNFQKTAAEDVQKQQETLYAPIIQKAQNAIQAVGAEGGYTFIFDTTVGSILYTGANAEDVGSLVKAKLGIK